MKNDKEEPKKQTRLARAEARARILDRMVCEYQSRAYQLWHLCVLRRGRILRLMKREAALRRALAVATGVCVALGAVLASVVLGGQK